MCRLADSQGPYYNIFVINYARGPIFKTQYENMSPRSILYIKRDHFNICTRPLIISGLTLADIQSQILKSNITRYVHGIRCVKYSKHDSLLISKSNN